MEQIYQSKRPQLSKIYASERLEIMDFNPDTLSVSPAVKSDSPLIRLLSPSLLLQREVGALDQPIYNENVLRLLDDLQCPVLLLPRIKNETSVQRIGFLSDVLFTGRSTMALLAKIAKSLHAHITLFNIAETQLPEMDPAYARKVFADQGLSEINGVAVKLVNIKKQSSPRSIETIFDQYQITLAAATRQRKDLLYRLVS